LRTLRPLLIAAAIAAVAAGSAASAVHARLTVYAAASLTNALPQIDKNKRYSFGGSNMLAAQIEQGAPADVFASANTSLPAALHAKKLCSRPVVFARNTLVIVTPKGNPAGLDSVNDLARAGVKLVIADPGVPVGGYTLKLLQNLKLTAKVLPNVVSRETDVREVLAKVVLGEADAGVVYATDAKVDRDKVTVVKVPRGQPNIQSAICVVSHSKHKAEARTFVAKVLGKRGQAKLRAAGFLSPKKR
jgi:molybdate transport system substrate-binding protein